MYVCTRLSPRNAFERSRKLVFFLLLRNVRLPIVINGLITILVRNCRCLWMREIKRKEIRNIQAFTHEHTHSQFIQWNGNAISWRKKIVSLSFRNGVYQWKSERKWTAKLLFRWHSLSYSAFLLARNPRTVFCLIFYFFFSLCISHWILFGILCALRSPVRFLSTKLRSRMCVCVRSWVRNRIEKHFFCHWIFAFAIPIIRLSVN